MFDLEIISTYSFGKAKTIFLHICTHNYVTVFKEYSILDICNCKECKFANIKHFRCRNGYALAKPDLFR